MKKLLKNVNIVITRAKNQSVDTINQFENLGANVISFPTIKISTLFNDKDLEFTIKRINTFNTIVFTSENAVRSLMRIVEKLKINFNPHAYFVISIGDKTTQVCKELGFRVDFQSLLASSDNLVKELGYIDLVGRKILIPSSSLSDSNRFNELENYGAVITSIPVYENSINDPENLKTELDIIQSTDIQLFIFTSPSTFNGFLEILDIENPLEYFDKKNIAVIGPVTRKALQKRGIEPNIYPSNYTMNNLIEEIKKFYNQIESKI